MIRKAIILVLTVAALGTAALAGMSFLWWPDGWAADIAPNLEVYHAGREWYIDFAPSSPPDLPKNLKLHAGKVTLHHVVVPTYDISQEQVTRVEFGGFCYAHAVKKRSLGPTPRPYRRLWKVQIPLFPMCILFAAYPAIAFIRGPLRRHRRRRKGWCIKCAYNLTGNVSGFCPECGTHIAAGTRRSCGV